MTIPLPITWPYALVFWPTYVWAFIPEFRLLARTRPDAPGTGKDRGSMGVVLMGFNGAICAAVLLAFVVQRAALPGPRWCWFFAGVITLVAGSLLRRHCFRVLGQFFTGTVVVQADHRVIDSGAYRWVRHPSYSAALLMILGIAVAFGNWLGALVAMGIALLAYSYRARVEEQALLASLGAPYAEFLATRKRFVPGIW
jgi:protein-S-isoprenylcysteine O-methyltransferase Ste14